MKRALILSVILCSFSQPAFAQVSQLEFDARANCELVLGSDASAAEIEECIPSMIAAIIELQNGIPQEQDRGNTLTVYYNCHETAPYQYVCYG